MLLTALADVHVLLFAAIYFLIQMSVYGVVFYLPSEIASVLGTSVGMVVGLVSAVPWICALIMVLWLPRIAVRFESNRIVASFTLVIAAVASAIFPASTPGSRCSQPALLLPASSRSNHCSGLFPRAISPEQRPRAA